MAEGLPDVGARTRRVWEVAVPVGLGVVLTVLDSLGVMSSDYAAAGVLGVLGIIGYSQIERDRRSAAQITAVESQLSAIQQAFDGVSELQFYHHHELFYRALAHQVSQAKEEVLVSYFRRYGPDELNSPVVHDYFATCEEWVLAAPTHQLRRVVTSEDTPALASWKEAQRRLANDHRARYMVRIVDVRGDVLSVSIIDKERIFVTAGTDPYVVSGFSLRSPRLGEYLRKYHQSLWDRGHDITLPPR